MSQKLSDLVTAGVDTSPLGKDAIYKGDYSTGTPASSASYLADVTALGSLQGVLVNGKIDVSVASSDLTVAIKAIDGTNPSTTNPVVVRIGDSYRRITSALSITLNDGTNYFGMNGLTSTFAVDYFVYLTWVSGSSTVSVGFAMFPYFQTYADGSGTNTNYKYFANSTTPASSDVCVNVGRFTATLSGSATYQWSSPTNVISRPIYESNCNTYTVTWAGSTTNPVIGNGTIAGMYQITGRIAYTSLRVVCGSTTTYGSGTYTFTIPFSTATITNMAFDCMVAAQDISAGTLYTGSVPVSGATIWPFTHGTTQMSPTVPFTFANTDRITITFQYPIA